MAKSKAKRQVSTPTVPRKETPHHLALPGGENSDARICWRFCHIDHDGPWGFNKVDAPMLRDILDKLAHFESMTIRELFTRRLYGFLLGHVFHVVWWDPDHEIWPSKLKHT